MKFVKLESVSSAIDYGLTQSATDRDTGHKFLRITDIREGNIDWSEVPFCQCNESDARRYELRDGDIVFARTGSVGNTGLVTGAPKGAVFASYLIRVRPNPGLLDPRFLSYFFQTGDYWHQVEAGAVGAIQGGLNASKLKELDIPLPSLPEQRRITALLASADRLRKLRRYGESLSESILHAVFLEMFGDPASNPRNWETKTLRECSLIFSDGPFGSDLKTEHYQESGIRVIRLQNIGLGKFLDDDRAYVTHRHFESLKKHRCLPGDVIIGTLGDPNLRACVLPSHIPLALNKADCVQLRVNPKHVNSAYASALLNMPETLYLANGMIHGQTRSRINMGRLAELEIPVPRLEQQERFAAVVRRVERLQARARESARQGEELFQALLSQSFTSM